MQETLLGRGTLAESRRAREPRGTALPHGSVSGVLVMALASGMALATHLAWPIA